MAAAINAAFGSFDAFKEKFEAAGVGASAAAGPGWWPAAKLKITHTPTRTTPSWNGEGSPSSGRRVGTRLLPQVPKPPPDYLKAWWNVVNWDEVNKRLAQADSFFK